MDCAFKARLASYPTLAPGVAVSLVRAARAYRDAVWIAEVQPELAWLLLVAALECASNSWRKNIASSEVRLEEVDPELAMKLKPLCDGLAYSVIERELAGGLKVKAKFLAFCMKFGPRAGPSPRPDLGGFPWADEALMKAALEKIYRHRSRALHDAIPIPTPMCMVAVPYSEESPVETVTGLATATRSGAWLQEDTPMLLHAFEWITRCALLAWWDHLRSEC